MLQKLIRCACLGVVALGVVSCFSSLEGQSKYDGYIVMRFEPDAFYEWEQFVREMFNDGKDTVSVSPYFSTGGVAVCSKLDDGGRFLGGFALCRGVDTLSVPDRAPSRFAVFDKGGNLESHAYGVYHDTTATLMPEHAVLMQVPNEASSCVPTTLYVQNVQAVVQAVQHGTGLSGGPFQAGDHLTLTVTLLKGDAAVGEKSVKLVDGTHVLDEWTKVELPAASNADAMDLRLASSRDDLPLYCALDDLVFHFIEIY